MDNEVTYEQALALIALGSVVGYRWEWTKYTTQLQDIELAYANGVRQFYDCGNVKNFLDNYISRN